MPGKKQLLKSYDVMEISFVPEGAVEESFIKIVKNKGGNMPQKSLVEKIESIKLENLEKISEIAKKHELSEDEVEYLKGFCTINKAAESAKVINAFAELEGIQKEKIVEVEKVVEKIIEKEKVVEGSEEIDFSKLDDKTKAAIEKSKVERTKIEKELDETKKILKAKEEAEKKAVFVAKAKDLPGLGEQEVGLGELLKDISDKIEKEKFDKLEKLLKSASEAIMKGSKMQGGIFGEIGTSSSESLKDADQKLESIAKQKVEKAKSENKSLTFEQAIDQALKENPELYQG